MFIPPNSADHSPEFSPTALRSRNVITHPAKARVIDLCRISCEHFSCNGRAFSPLPKMEVECLALKDLSSPRKSFKVEEDDGGQSEQKVPSPTS